MKRQWHDSARFFAALAGSLLLNLPIYYFKYGSRGIFSFCLLLSSIYIAVAVLEIFRRFRILPKLSRRQRFDRRLNIAFVSTLPFFLANVADEFFPRYIYKGIFRGETFAAVAGLLYGMLTGLLIDVQEGEPTGPMRVVARRWIRFGMALGIALGIVTFVVDGLSTDALARGMSVLVAFELGLGLGLFLGHYVNDWTEALEPTFALIRRMARTLIAFAAGFLIIVLLFASFFGAAWKLEGADCFQGLPATPTLTTFIYFSLLTATTVGYGDIAPLSGLTRVLTGMETLAALAWTLVVFAALSVRFADAVRSVPSQRPSDNSSDSGRVQKEDSAEQ